MDRRRINGKSSTCQAIKEFLLFPEVNTTSSFVVLADLKIYDPRFTVQEKQNRIKQKPEDDKFEDLQFI